ncbi:MAG: LysR family transcriptional regulator [Alphaproteobacteria bacterium]|nr:LysR family transcriptional regulator [Alphaproteobacteria bacterium]
MDLRRLRYFVTVAEELHFGRAARRLNISQPPLSQQIRKLEDEVGAQLFVRMGRQVTLSDAGEAFLGRAYLVIREYEAAMEAARQAEKGATGTLEIAYIPPADLHALPLLVSKFQKAFPSVNVVLRSMHGLSIPHAIQSGRVKVGVVRLPLEYPGLETLSVVRERLSVVVPESHGFARRRQVKFSELAGQRLIGFPRSLAPAYYDVIAGLCKSHGGFVYAPSQEVETIQTALSLVSAGLGVSIQPRSIEALCRKGLRPAPISDSPACAAIGVAYPVGARQAVLDNFLSIARSIAR